MKEKNHQAHHSIQLKHWHFLSSPRNGFNELAPKEFTFSSLLLPCCWLLGFSPFISCSQHPNGRVLHAEHPGTTHPHAESSPHLQLSRNPSRAGGRGGTSKHRTSCRACKTFHCTRSPPRASHQGLCFLLVLFLTLQSKIRSIKCFRLKDGGKEVQLSN